MRRVLITGIAGGLARQVAKELLSRGDHVVGVDYRELKNREPELKDLEVFQANYNKTVIEDIFRKNSFTHVLHLGRVGNLKESSGKRFDLNVVGSQKIMNLCVQHGVTRLVVMSTFHIYGAHPANHIPISEEEPLRAGMDFPQLADAIQLDNMAATWVWRHEDVHVCVLRPTNVIGPMLRNTISELLRQPTIPRLLGFDPMMQFLHEKDLADAIVLACDKEQRGIFNVTGRGVIPWTTAIEIAGSKSIPLPSSAVRFAVKYFSALPEYLVNFFKYPCVISDKAFRDSFGYQARVSIAQSIETTVAEARELARQKLLAKHSR
ncbi:MAG: NAD-dependent epimerase/dehydratase family protein [Sandaracinaceae bacterium]|nr:NAD-dependent epimerase/dehydratase family protein [Sandaracinaceae bacterium]